MVEGIELIAVNAWDKFSVIILYGCGTLVSRELLTLSVKFCKRDMIWVSIYEYGISATGKEGTLFLR